MKEIESYYPKAFLARYGTDFAELCNALDTTASSFEKTLNNVNDDVFYKEVAGRKWCPAEIADHVVKANKLFGRALASALNGEDTIMMARGRVTVEGLPLSPPEAEPLPARTRPELIKDLATTVEKIRAVAASTRKRGTLSDVCIHQAFFGPMTGLEVLQLAVWHMRHHEKQLPHFAR